LLLGLNDAANQVEDVCHQSLAQPLAKAFIQTRSVQLRRRIVGLVERIEQNRNRSTRNR